MRAFLQSQVRPMANQIAAVIAHHGTRKAAPSLDELLALDEVVANLDFAGWSVLAGDIEDTLAEIVKDQGIAALDSVGIDVTANTDVLNVVSQDALDYGKERSAEMVGMRVNDAGELVQNPNAEWQITEGTREGIRATVEDAMRTGATNDEIAATLQDAYAFSDERAMMIARTETQMAANAGALAGYKASGVVQGKLWSTAEDDLVSEDCQENADAGELALEAEFPSGDDAPPAHPNCRCSIVPVVIEATDTEEDDTTTVEDATVEDTTVEDVIAATADTEITDAQMDEVAAQADETANAPDIRWYGDMASDDAMQTRFRDIVDAIPDSVLGLLSDKGVTFNFADKLIDINPELKGVRPRGYPRGMTWENTNGFFDNADGRIVVSSDARSAGSREYVEKPEFDATVRHEAGHGVDYAMDQISASPDFNAAYWKDRRALTADQRDRLSYFMQKGVAGPSETFAEVFASIVNGGVNRSWRSDMLELFPNVRAFIDDLISGLDE